MRTYSIDPLYPDRLRCDRCGLDVALVTGPVSAFGLAGLSYRQVADYFPEAAERAELHKAACGRPGK
jgi:hypothetical protein